MNLKTDIQKLIDNHFIWLRDKTILKELGSEWVEITTPYLDRHNDCIQIYVKRLFLEDVTQWMDSLNVRYLPKVKFTGKSGFDHMFDFAIPKSSKQPERMIEVLNNPNKDSAESLIFKWLDTRENRHSDSKLFAILNNKSIANLPSVLDAFPEYKAVGKH